MTKHIQVGNPSCASFPNGAKKHFIADKNSAHVYVKSTWHGPSGFGGTSFCDFYGQLEDTSGTGLATNNPQSNWNKAVSIVKYHTFTYNVIAGTEYVIAFYTTDCSPQNIPGVSDVTISTDAIP